jgi:hypothetical protein
MAATWMVLGSKGVAQFQMLRKSAIDGLIKEFTNSRNGEKILDPGDHFHGATKVLNVVTQWHNFLKQTARRTDNLTAEVLTLVDYNMLIDAKGVRLSASQLRTQLDSIIQTCGITSRDITGLEVGIVRHVETAFGVPRLHDSSSPPALRETTSRRDQKRPAPPEDLPDHETDDEEPFADPIPGIGREDSIILTKEDEDLLWNTDIHQILKHYHISKRKSGAWGLVGSVQRRLQWPAAGQLLAKFIKNRDFVSLDTPLVT